MFENILSQLNSGSKEFVGVSVNSNGLLEIAQVNRASNEIMRYTNRQIHYNPITREIENYDGFRDELGSGLEELNLNPRSCNITISLPNVTFGIKELPEIVSSDDEIMTSITSDVEESYLFKQVTPIVCWKKLGDDTDISDDGMHKYAYCALQETALKELRRVCTELGANLISIQNSFSTLFEGLNFAGTVTKVTNNARTPWNVLLISGTSYSVFHFLGDKLQDYMEEPLAVRSFTPEEIYSTVSSMASMALQNYSSDNLLVISETDEVSAEVISTKLGFAGIPYYFEQNKFQQGPPVDLDLNVLPGFAPQVSICLVGAAVDHFESKFFKFNYLVQKDGSSTFEAQDLVTIGNKTFELTKEKANKYALFAVAGIIVLFVIIGFGLNAISDAKDKKLNALTAEETRLQEEVSKSQNENPTIDINSTIDKIADNNRKKRLYYDALSYGIPEKVWIEYFYAGPNNAIAINGVAVESSDIALFLKGIREVAGESNVSVTKLIMNGGDGITSTGPDTYNFELASQAFNGSGTQTQPSNTDNGSQPQNSEGSGSDDIPPADSPSVPPPIIE